MHNTVPPYALIWVLIWSICGRLWLEIKLILVAEQHWQCYLCYWFFFWIVSHNTDKALKLPILWCYKAKNPPLMTFRDVCPSLQAKRLSLAPMSPNQLHLKSRSIQLLHRVAISWTKLSFFGDGLPFTVHQTINHYFKPLLQTLLSAMCCLMKI